MTPNRVIKLLILLAVVASTNLAGTATAETDADLEQAFSDLRSAYYEAETPVAKLDIIKAFLTEYPESKYTAPVLNAGTYLLSEELNDPTGAVAYTQEILKQVDDPEVLSSVRLVLVELYGHPEYATELTALTAEMASSDQMSFADYQKVIAAAVGAEAWDLTLQQITAASPLASKASFEADHPDQEFDAEYIQQAVRNRKGLMGTYRGWALANQDESAAALRSFAESEGLLKFSYLGVPENDLYLYWGKTKLTDGKVDEALKMLSLAGVWGYNDEAMQAAREIYTTQKGSEAEFENYLWQVRNNSAQTLEAFTLNDYEEQPQTFSELKGKVTLLAFWFPT